MESLKKLRCQTVHNVFEMHVIVIYRIALFCITLNRYLAHKNIRNHLLKNICISRKIYKKILVSFCRNSGLPLNKGEILILKCL